MITFLALEGNPICSVVLLNTLLPALNESPVKVLPVTAPFEPSNVIWLPPEETVTDLLAFTVSTVIALFKEVVIFLPLRATVILLSPLKDTVSSLLITSLRPLSLSAANFQLYALAETALLIASATFLASAIPAAFAEA